MNCCRLLMFSENTERQLLHFWQSSALILSDHAILIGQVLCWLSDWVESDSKNLSDQSSISTDKVLASCRAGRSGSMHYCPSYLPTKRIEPHDTCRASFFIFPPLTVFYCCSPFRSGALGVLHKFTAISSSSIVFKIGLLSWNSPQVRGWASDRGKPHTCAKVICLVASCFNSRTLSYILSIISPLSLAMLDSWLLVR